MSTDLLHRRRFLAGLGAAALAPLAACQTPVEGQSSGQTAMPTMARNTEAAERFREMMQNRGFAEWQRPPVDLLNPDYDRIYGAMVDDGFSIPAVPWERMNPRLLRQLVPNPTGEQPGTLVVETRQHLLYWTMPRNMALRYGVGLGREGFEWSGRAEVARKARWPKWHPPAEMIDREPQLERYRTSFNRDTNEWVGGMEGGPENPLGARALYIFEGRQDTLYRIHGNPQWSSIGRSVSSGCVRMINQDVIDLYSRVPEGTPILVR